MSQFNIDLLDGKPPVSFVLSGEDAGRFMDFMNRYSKLDRSVATDYVYLQDVKRHLDQGNNDLAKSMISDWIDQLEEIEVSEAWTRNDEVTLAATLLVSAREFTGPVTLERIEKWSDEECQAVEQYCKAIHINANDNDDYPIPAKPAVMTELFVKNGWEPLHKRAQRFLTKHGDFLQDTKRSDDLVFLNAVITKNLVHGTEKQQLRMNQLQAEFTVNQPAETNDSIDISGCIKSNRS